MRNMQRKRLNKVTKKKEITEESILNSIKLEADSFVPNDLSAIEKATGTYNPFKEREDLTITEKFHNEGSAMVPNLEDSVLKKVGVKKSFSFSRWAKRHAVALASVSLVLVGGITGAVLAGTLAKSTNNGGTLLTVTFSASKEEASAKSLSDDGYTPSFTFYADSDNKVIPSSLSCDNYSASLVKEEEPSCFASNNHSDATSFASSLVAPSYSLGYLNATAESNPNTINITYLSSDSSYGSKYETSFKNAFDTSLKDKKTYAKVTFSEASGSNELTSLTDGTNSEKTKNIAFIYRSFSINGTPLISASSLASEDNDVLSQMRDTYASIRESRLSPLSLQGSIAGGAKAYNSYKEGGEKSEEDLATLKQRLEDGIGALPWFKSDWKSSLDYAVQDDSYYLFSLPELEKKATPYTSSLTINDEGSALSYFFHIRDELIKGLDKNSYLSLLSKAKTRSEKATGLTNASAFPDGFDDGSRPDHGDHGGPGGGFGGGEGGGIIG